jgi:hypothetical protein
MSCFQIAVANLHKICPTKIAALSNSSMLEGILILLRYHFYIIRVKIWCKLSRTEKIA